MDENHSKMSHLKPSSFLNKSARVLKNRENDAFNFPVFHDTFFSLSYNVFFKAVIFISASNDVLVKATV